MTSFASELAHDIRQEPSFWADLASLRAAGIRSTLLPSSAGTRSSEVAVVQGPDLNERALVRLLNSASIFAQATDATSLDLAQQIAVFASLASDDTGTYDAAVHILTGLGNFPGLTKLRAQRAEDQGLQSRIRTALLRELNSVDMAGKRVALTNFQFGVWDSLQNRGSTAISAPTSAGKSYVVMEHLCESAIAAEKFVALYIAPTRALLTEIQGKLEKRLAAITDKLRVTTVPVLDPEDRPKQIYVLTQERAQLLLSTVNVSGLIDLVIIDEAQAIGDDSRGMILQDAVEKVHAANSGARFLFLAPGASGFELVGDSVGISELDVRETSLSPVVQNRISVSFPVANEHLVELDLVTATGLERIGSYTFERGFALTEDAKLAAVAEEFGSSGRSLVYATGAKNAEDLTALIALNRKPHDSPSLKELAKFIEEHVHKQYSLAGFVRRGVAFHYGNMPSLLREGIEASFRDGHLDYLCCTTTLFQGVNLPARNVFIDTPTRGKGDLLDEAALWNFAGRAGRLGEEIVGNVFLVDYENWETQPLTIRKPFEIKVAFKETLEAKFEEILDFLETASRPAPDEVRKRAEDRVTAAAGLVLFRAAQGNLDALLGRASLSLSADQKTRLSSNAREALTQLGLPSAVLTSSWMVDPVALASLLTRQKELIRKGEFSKLMPVNPASDAYTVYNSIIRRMYKHLGGMTLSGEEGKKARGFVNHVTVTALSWMRGDPLTKLVRDAVKYRVSVAKQGPRLKPEQTVVDAAIREMFTLIEQTIRFKLVQWAKAYVDLLKFALEVEGRPEMVAQVYDFSLALELGVSTKTGRSLVEFGLSRITASAIAALITDSSLPPDKVKAWIGAQPPEMLSKLSGLILAELRAKELLGSELEDDNLSS
ncbi:MULTISPECIES: DEAD/DEAH box helicase [Stenotrophomonas]|uniref:DEAD/DEAH box helicase n=1 Tax=Stenotrophomonas TaxID=40323 RepID=UPI0015DE535B|nr:MULTISPECIES: DEAD/DEAH box helicase [Stenotrophomonas]MBA0432589.1 DEAD/DEAH box helicase [Stenotrophomonas maltophilia]MDH0276038.1 DEAD/DEAH box helicase [Stenotrophomonas sp. GD04089]UQA71656.1 DEAD/DEAH box helicase [Stenotrophomonas maltophilia]